MTVSKKIEYGLAVLLFLSKNREEMTSLRQVAKSLGLPYRFLGQVTTSLSQAGMVESKEGKNGGYWLADNWGERSVYDLIVALGEDKRLVTCLEDGGEGCKRFEGCKIKKVWQRAERALQEELKRSKLRDI